MLDLVSQSAAMLRSCYILCFPLINLNVGRLTLTVVSLVPTTHCVFVYPTCKTQVPRTHAVVVFVSSCFVLFITYTCCLVLLLLLFVLTTHMLARTQPHEALMASV